jgi:hypothetical protein
MLCVLCSHDNGFTALDAAFLQDEPVCAASGVLHLQETGCHIVDFLTKITIFLLGERLMRAFN